MLARHLIAGPLCHDIPYFSFAFSHAVVRLSADDSLAVICIEELFAGSENTVAWIKPYGRAW